MKSTVSLPVRLWRICRLVVHLFRGLVLVSGRYGRLNRAGRAHAARDWGHRLLSILGARVRVEGEPPEMICANSFFVANHVSWLDIFAIQSVSATRFVAKSEIRRWPVVGWLVTRAGTLYIERASRFSPAYVDSLLGRFPNLHFDTAFGNARSIYPLRRWGTGCASPRSMGCRWPSPACAYREPQRSTLDRCRAG